MRQRPDPDPEFEKWLNAARNGDSQYVQECLAQGMNVNAGKFRTNATALVAAVRGSQVEMVRLLLDHGADPNLEDCFGYTSVTHALFRSRSFGSYQRKPNLSPDPRPLELLLANGGRLRLREAVLMNDVELARDRLDQGDDVDSGRGKYHGPLLMIASELGHIGIVNLLLDRGADIEAMDDLGQRPLLRAAYHGQTDVVLHLLDRGADLNAVDWSGQSALGNAAIKDHHELFDLLLSRGARRGIVDALARNEQQLFETLVEEEIRSGSDVDSLSDGRFRLALLAAQRGNVDALQFLLDRGSVHLERRERHSLLAEAAMHGQLAAAQLLLDRGADLHDVGEDGHTPLAWAKRENQAEVVRLLESAGAMR